MRDIVLYCIVLYIVHCDILCATGISILSHSQDAVTTLTLERDSLATIIQSAEKEHQRIVSALTKQRNDSEMAAETMRLDAVEIRAREVGLPWFGMDCTDHILLFSIVLHLKNLEICKMSYNYISPFLFIDLPVVDRPASPPNYAQWKSKCMHTCCHPTGCVDDFVYYSCFWLFDDISYCK